MLSIAHSESNIHCVVVLHVCVCGQTKERGEERRISKSNREDTDRRYRRALLHLNPGKNHHRSL